VADTLQSFALRVDRFEKSLTDAQIGHALGKMAKAEAEKAASADLGGDPKFSGWAPTLDTRYDIVRRGAILFKPTRRSAGPWTVAERGRNSGAGPGLGQSSTAMRFTPTGRVSRQRVKRWNGRTAGKSTATKAITAIDKKAPKAVDEHVDKAVRKFFN
jgi:hypothetical protein